MSRREIFITKLDRERLLDLIKVAEESSQGKQDQQGLRDLRGELERAHVVDPKEVPSDVVTMNTRVVLRDVGSGAEMTCTLVFPRDADMAKGAVSVLAPVGTAILGYREGDTIEWTVPSGPKRFTVERILYQPEAAGDFEL